MILNNAVNGSTILSEVEAFVRTSQIARAVDLAKEALANGVVHPLLLYLRAYWFSEQGRDAEAMKDLEEAIRIAPGDANIYNTYGQILVRLQKPREAAAAFETAVSLAPNLAQAHYNLGGVREGLGEIEAAEQCFRNTARIDPNHIEAWARLAKIASRRGQNKEAHELANRAFALTPLKLERPQETAEAFERAISLAPNFPQAHFGLGYVRIGLGELEAAEQSFRNAVQIDPNYAEAWAQLAEIASRHGQFKEAHKLADRALSLKPNLHLAMQNHVATALVERDFERAEFWLSNKLLKDPSLSPLDRAVAKGSLGDLRHAQHRYEEAFAAYSQSAAEKYAIYAPTFEPRGGRTVYSHGEWLVEYFGNVETADWSVRTRKTLPPDSRDGARGHAFLVGFPRSGTTLLENILASHPQIVALEERGTLDDAFLAFMPDIGKRDRLAQITPAQIEEQRALYWRNVRRHGAQVEGKLLVDKYPLNTIQLPIIARLFPDAHILFAIRDPRDIVLSCFRRNFWMNPYVFEFLSLERAARYYAIVMQLREIYRQKLELDWLDLRLEDLVRDFEGTARAACAFLGVDWDVRMQNFAENAKKRSISTPSAPQVVRGINSEGIGVWRNYRTHMEPVLPTLAPWIEKFGYSE